MPGISMSRKTISLFPVSFNKLSAGVRNNFRTFYMLVCKKDFKFLWICSIANGSSSHIKILMLVFLLLFLLLYHEAQSTVHDIYIHQHVWSAYSRWALFIAYAHYIGKDDILQKQCMKRPKWSEICRFNPNYRFYLHNNLKSYCEIQ